MAVDRQWDIHSRLVFWMKILLPIAAILILSTLFMVSHSVRPEDAIPYADVDIASLIKEPRLTAPVFAGMTGDGAALTLKASAAKLGNADGSPASQISDLDGVLETPDGANTHLTAAQANLDKAARVAVLTGKVHISNSAGYQIDSQSIHVALDQTSIDSPGAVTALGPVGKITAGSMHIGLAKGGLAGGSASRYVLLFKGGVTLIYLPSKRTAGN